jgi:hypothetical protein
MATIMVVGAERTEWDPHAAASIAMITVTTRMAVLGVAGTRPLTGLRLPDARHLRSRGALEGIKFRR